MAFQLTKRFSFPHVPQANAFVAATAGQEVPSWGKCQSHDRSTMSAQRTVRGKIRLRPSIRQIVEIEMLPVTVDVRADQSKAIEVGADGQVFLRHLQTNPFSIESDHKA